MNKSDNTIKIGHLNIQSAAKKRAEIENYIALQQLDVLSLNETWLKNTSNFKIANFKIIRKDRQDNSGYGGVCLIIRESLSYEELDNSSFDNLEAIGIKIHKCLPNNQDLLLVSYNNPPNKIINWQFLNHIQSFNEPSLIVGDLNAHNTNWHSRISNTSGKILQEFLDQSNLAILNNSVATYQPLHKIESSSIIDLAICSENLAKFFLNFNTNEMIRSDHIAIELSFKSSLKRQKTSIKIDQFNIETF